MSPVADTPDPVTGARPLSRADTRELLETILAAAGQPDAVVAFDLDSTLLDNSPRQARIMREYGAEVGLEALETVAPEHWDGWDFRLPMARVGVADAEIERHAHAFKEYWRARFFTSDYCVSDRPIAGAPEYVHAVAAVARVYYVTGRHEPMRSGSVACFESTGFPLPDGDAIRLLMKPDLEEGDDAYKLRTYEVLRSHGVVVAAFDNEPAHINGYRQAFPDAHAVHLATDHSMRPIRVAEGIPSIESFAPFVRT